MKDNFCWVDPHNKVKTGMCISSIKNAGIFSDHIDFSDCEFYRSCKVSTKCIFNHRGPPEWFGVDACDCEAAKLDRALQYSMERI